MTDEVPVPSEDGGEAPAPLDDRVLSQLVRELADAVVVADPESVIVFWNPVATRLFGWSALEAVGRSLDLIIPERLRARHWDGYRRVMETGHTEYGTKLLEVPALHRDGHTLSLAFTVTLLKQPGEARPYDIVAVLRDDTQRRRELKEARDGLASVRTATEAAER